jgi:hypothetical protein
MGHVPETLDAMDLLQKLFGGPTTNMVYVIKNADPATLAPFEGMELQIARCQQLLTEVKKCCGNAGRGIPLPVYETFLNLVATAHPQKLVPALTVAVQAGARPQLMEELLRFRNLDCWLVAVDGTKDGLPCHALTMTLNYGDALARTYFKEPGSYTKNFETLEKAVLLPCACHPIPN